MKEFFENVLRYPRYFIAIILGVFWNFLEPLIPMMRRPSTAIAAIGLLVSLFLFLGLTLQAMLGLSI